MSEIMLDRRLSVAPMMDWTDRHCRYLHRLITPHALLYTEMIHANALLHGDSARHLAFNTAEQPVALQLGGSDPSKLAIAARMGQDAGYAEINLNCGCPSDRVQSGNFGACLMAEPALVADCIAAMRAAVTIPVTVKTRIGIDDHDSYEFLSRFVEVIATAGCNVFIIHARKAWLHGLSPKENRDIPPLDWARVHQLKRDYPHLTMITNGGFATIPDIMAQMEHVDGVMIGRKAYHEPYFLAQLEQTIYGAVSLPTKEFIAAQFFDYMQQQHDQGEPLKRMTRHGLGLWHGQPRAKVWKNMLMRAAQSNDVMDLQIP